MPGYILTPVSKVPTKPRGSIYREILQDFLDSRYEAQRVDIEDRKPISVYQGLIKARKQMEADVKISNANGEVYLQRRAA